MAIALAGPWVPGAAAPALVRAFEAMPDPTGMGAGWQVGKALRHAADASIFEDLCALLEDDAYGRAREHLLVALGRTHHPGAFEVLSSFLNKELKIVFVIDGLGILGDTRALPLLAPLAEAGPSAIRREARKAIRAIEQASGKRTAPPVKEATTPASTSGRGREPDLAETSAGLDPE